MKIKGNEKYEFYSIQLQCHSTSHSTHPNPSHVLENATQPNPTQPNSWMDPTHVHLCSLGYFACHVACTECKGAAYCYVYSVVCVSAWLLDTAMSCVKTAEVIQMPFEMFPRVGPRSHVYAGAGSPLGKRQFGESIAPSKLPLSLGDPEHSGTINIQIHDNQSQLQQIV